MKKTSKTSTVFISEELKNRINNYCKQNKITLRSMLDALVDDFLRDVDTGVAGVAKNPVITIRIVRGSKKVKLQKESCLDKQCDVSCNPTCSES